MKTKEKNGKRADKKRRRNGEETKKK